MVTSEQEQRLLAIGPLDGRYAARRGPLTEVVSEYGLIRNRVEVMAGWVGVLGSGVLPDREPLSDRAQDRLVGIVQGFDIPAAQKVKDIEKTTNHDVKAAELWLTDQIDGPDFDHYRTLVHFGCTSEDVNSAAYGLMLGRARDKVILPKIDSIDDQVDSMSTEWAGVPMLALTHGQPATPTTLGKEMRVFDHRLTAHMTALGGVNIAAKFSGATGGHNATTFAYPEVNWRNVTRDYVEDHLGLDYNAVTTQIEPHDWMGRMPMS